MNRYVAKATTVFRQGQEQGLQGQGNTALFKACRQENLLVTLRIRTAFDFLQAALLLA